MTAPTVMRTRVSRVPANTFILVAAWIVSSLEGYDLAVYGVTVPSILGDPSLGIDKAEAGTIGSLVGIGMLIGAAFAGALVHRTGPRRLLLAGTGLFTLGMAICTVAGGVPSFGTGRLIVGLGLGVVLPTINAYVADLSDPGRRSRNVALIMSGYAAGALLSPLLGTALLPDVSYRWLYVIGVLPVFLAIPLVLRLPESPFHLRRTGRADEARAVEERLGLTPAEDAPTADPGRWLGLGSLLTGGLAVSTVLFWAMSFCGLLLVFGISTWLPSIMQAAGFSLGSALLQTAAMWLGVGVGAIVGGRIADALGAKRVVVVAFLVGTLSLIAMSTRPPTAVMFVLMFISGFGFIGSQILGNAFIVTRYPDAVRGNGLAWALSIGRFGAIVGPSLGAYVLSSGADIEWAFYAFAVPALLGAFAAGAVPRARRVAA
ncbi:MULTISPECIES: MFS transporter [Streptomyces]|uniref:MFS transporter n=1 Tax=Streptomyces caniscabiei TaxID=2746961 RepID=A0ABU4MLQ2_9ACTN|nr:MULTISPECIES: MFS transporter [Streptomyces]MBE4733710.1 MFS transporter [Streptomyces caniscabiei]MBE4754887.1 MFS transporter [Streptomyces caniscabiei]MBE4768294.1 MFS transporter [Streptomyces caniscabiei]MBE4782205.1 MFS transporter [Streptomyces caniscabiei]MBE4793493.1 MFS transporter [Streptomyces caniscabiei]